MSRRTTALAAALSVLMLGSPLIAGCGAQSSNSEAVSNAAAGLSSEDILALNDEIAELTKLLETNPQDAAAYYNRGVAKKKSGNYQGAIADFNKAIEFNPQNSSAYNNRGYAKELLGDLSGGCADSKKAVSLGSQSAAQWLNSEGGAWCRNMR